jgi:hypothetical protein
MWSCFWGPVYITAVGPSSIITEGYELTLSPVAVFTDFGYSDLGQSETFTYTVDWGDGSTPDGGDVTAVVTGTTAPRTGGTINASHTYADDGLYTVTVTVRDDDGGVDTDTFTVTVVNDAPILSVVSNRSADEGIAFTIPNIGTFTDRGWTDASLGASETFTYRIDWGDNIESTGSVTAVTNGRAGVRTTGAITGSHTYADDGMYTVRVTVTDDDGGSQSRTFTIRVDNVDPTIDSSPADQIVDEGELLSLSTLVSFSDPAWTDGVRGSNETFSYTIDWGDGSTVDSGNITDVVTGSLGVSTTGSFGGSHTYADNGVYTVTISLDDDDGGADTATFTVTVNNVAPTITADAGDQTINENQTLTLTDLVSFSDPGFTGLSTSETFTYSIDWGDGSAVETGNVSDLTNGSAGTATVGSIDGSHVYADDDDSPYTVTVGIYDDDGNFDTTTLSVDVNNVAPTLTVLSSQTITEGYELDLPGIGSFLDPGYSDSTVNASESFTYSIDWGDGSVLETGVPATVNGSELVSTTGAFSGSYTYADNGIYTVTIAIYDDNGGSDTGTFTVTVDNEMPVLTVAADRTEAEGIAFTVSNLLTFSDRGWTDATLGASERFTYTIDWGDGNIVAATAVTDLVNGGVGVRTQGGVTATHTYEDNGTYTVTLTLVDDDAGSAVVSDTLQIDVTNDPPVVMMSGSATVSEHISTQRTYNFTLADDGLSETFSIVGTSCGAEGSVVAGSPTINPVTGAGSLRCLFPDGEVPAITSTVQVTVSDGTDIGVGSRTVTINNVTPNVTAPANQSANEGQAKSFALGSFTDAGNDAPWTVTVDWGDTGSDDLFTMSAPGTITPRTHTYPDNGVYTVTVSVEDKDGATSTPRTFTITVSNVAPVITAVGPSSTITEGYELALSPVAIFTDFGYSDLGQSESFTYTVDWGDGSTPDTGDVTAVVTGTTAPRTGGTINASHTYADDGLYTVTVIVRDDDGGVDTDTFTVTVVNDAPILDAGADQNVFEGELVSLDPATFVDRGTLDTHTATVDWGDDSSPATATVNSTPYGPPGSTAGVTGTVSASYRYADDGVYTVIVALTDDNGAVVTDTLTITVDNVDPTVTATGDVTRDEGQTFTVTNIVTFTDPGWSDVGLLGASETFTYSIDWGDDSPEITGTVTTITNGGPGIVTSGAVTGSHTYADDGAYVVTVTIFDDDGGSNGDTFTINVDNVEPTITAIAANQSITEGLPLTIPNLVTFADPGFTDGTLLNASETFTYSIDWGDGNISTSGADLDVINGSIGVSTTGALSATHTYTDDGSFPVTVTLYDDDGGSASDTLQVTVINNAPTVFVSGPTPVDESKQITRTYTFTIEDTGIGAETYTISSGPFCGTGSYVPTTAVINGATGDGSFVCIFDDGPSNTFVSIDIDDGGNDPQTGLRSVTVNNLPPTAVNDNAFVNEDSTVVINVLANDTDPGNDTRTVINVGAAITGTPSVINSGANVRFDPRVAFDYLPAGVTQTDSFTYTVSDEDNATDIGTVTVVITGVNDAPVLDNTKILTLTTITEDDTTDLSNDGDAVSDIVRDVSNANAISDVDNNALEGIAITAASVASGDGKWQYSVNSGATWADFPSVSGTGSLLLRSIDRVRFLPDEKNATTANFTFRAWDQSDGGTAGSAANTSPNGGSTAFSIATDTASITVTAVNDAPVLTAALPTLTTITEKQTTNSGDLVSDIVGSSISDVDSGPVEGIAITAATVASGNGKWQYSINNGTTWIDFPSVSGTNSLLLRPSDRVRFLPDEDNGTTAAITYRAWDQTSGTAGGTANTSTPGETTAFSTATDTASITVTAVNDAPVNTVPGAQSIDEDEGLTFENTELISIADVDAGSNAVSVALTATNGTLTLNGVVGLTFSVGDGTTDTTLRFTGTLTAINAALDGMVFTPTPNYNGSASVRIVTNDQGNSGSGGALSDDDTVSITVNAVNDPPVNTVPGAQSIDEDNTLTFTTGRLISIADVDAGSNPVSVALTATNGTLTLNGVAGLSFSVGDGTTDTTLRFTGTVTAINTALNGMVFMPTLNYSGPASVRIVTDDQGNSGAGGALSDDDTINITVNAVNDPPVFTLSGDVTVNEDFATTESVTVTAGLVPSDEVSQTVTYTITPASVSFANIDFNTVTGQVTITAVANGNGTQLFTVTADDGQSANNTATDTFTLTVNAVNDAPVFTLSADVTVNEDFATTESVTVTAGLVPSDEVSQTVTYTITPASVSFANIDFNTVTGQVTITAVANGNGTQLFTVTADDGQSANNTATDTFTLTVNPVNDAPSFSLSGDVTVNEDFATTESVTVTAGLVPSDEVSQTVTYTITPASVSFANIDFNTVTGQVTITAVANGNGTQLFTVTADDGQSANNTATDTFTLTVNAVNDPPVFTLSGDVTVNEDFVTTESVTVTAGLVPSDEVSQTVTYTITPASVSFANIDFNTVTGQVTITAVANGNGTQLFTVTADDGQSANNTATDTFTLTVNPVNDAPVNTVPVAQSIDEDEGLTFENTELISIADVDAGSNAVSVALTATNGTLTLNGVVGLTFSVGNGDADATMNFTGTLTAINTALDGMVFTPTLNYSGPASVRIVTNDQGNSGSGGALSDDDTVNITVNPVNDAPTINDLAGDALDYDEGDGTVVIDQTPAASVTDPDSTDFDTGTLTVTIASGGDNAEDQLSIRHQGTGIGEIGVNFSNVISYEGTVIGTFTGGSGGAPLVITLDSDANPTSVGALLRNITYENTDTDSPTTGDRTVRFVLSDGDGGVSANADVTVTVNAVNDPPTVSGTVTTTSLNDNAGATSIFNNVSVADVDASEIVTIEIGVTNNSAGAVSGGGFTLMGAGVYSVTGSVSVVNTALGNAQFTPANNTGLSGTFTTTFAITVTDSGNLSDNLLSASLTITRINDAPDLTGLDNPAAFLENTINLAPAIIDSAVVFTDVDSPDFDTGVITVSYSSGGGAQDQLSVRHEGNTSGLIGVSGSNVSYGGTLIGVIDGVNNGVNGQSLVIALNASATAEAVEALIQNLQYANTSDTPTANRTISIVVNDGDGGVSTSDTAIITVTAQNDAPTINNLAGDTLAYVENTGAQNIDQGSDASVTDPDSADFNTGVLTVTVVSGGDTSEDVLSIRDVGAPGIDVSSSNLSYNSQQFATFTGGSSGNPLVITFNANSTVTNISALLREITYRNSDTTNPIETDRTVRFVLTDGDGGISASTDVTVTVTRVNSTPTLTGLNSPAAFAEDTIKNTPTIIDSAVVFNDTDGGDFATGSLTVTYSSGGGVQDQLSVRNQGTGAGQIGVSGSNVSYGGVVIGVIDGTNNGINGQPLVITLNVSSLVVAVDALIQNLQYANSSDAPAASRTISIVVNDGDGGVSTPATAVITVNAANDAPVLSAAASPTLTAIDEDIADGSNSGDSIASIIVDGSITDPDGTAVEAIAVIGVNNTNGTWEYSTNNGSAWSSFDSPSVSAARLLDGTTTGVNTHRIRFRPTANFNGTSTITFRAWDKSSGTAGNTGNTSSIGGTTAYSVVTDTISITVNPVNDQPTLSGSVTTTGLNDNASPASIFNNVIVADVDTGETVTLTIQLSNSAAGTISGGGFSLVSAGLYRVTGLSVADANTALDNAQFTPENNTGSSGTFGTTFTVTVTDTGGLSSNFTSGTLTITRVNDAPLLNLQAITTTGYLTGTIVPMVIAPSALITDVDNIVLSGGILTVTIQSGGHVSDTLVIRQAAQVTVTGATVNHNGTAIGTSVAGSGASARLTVTLNSNATIARVIDLARTIAFSNTVSPGIVDRVVAFTVSDGAGGVSTPQTITVVVAQEGNDKSLLLPDDWFSPPVDETEIDASSLYLYLPMIGAQQIIEATPSELPVAPDSDDEEADASVPPTPEAMPPDRIYLPALQKD